MRGNHSVEMRIELASVEDAEQILALQRLAYQSEAQQYQDWSLPPLTQTLAELVGQFQTHTILKAMLGDTLVGSVRASSQNSYCTIGRLMVAPDMQGRGIGSALMYAIEDKFPQADEFRLFTGAQSESNIRLYTRLGYSIVGNEQVNETVSVVIMTKQI